MKFLRSDSTGGEWYAYFDQVSKEMLDCHVMYDGTKYYWKSEEIFKTGGRHRQDGPAIEHATFKEWWIDGKIVGHSYNGFTDEMFKKYLKLKSFW